MKETLKKVAAHFRILTAYDRTRKKEYERLLKLIEREKSGSNLKHGATVIVFSKDRALQLELLLRSYSDLVTDPADVFVLYNVSSSDFEQGYKKLIENYNGQKKFAIRWVKEEGFKKNLIQLFEKVKTEKIMFLVDDLFFKNEVNFNEFLSLDTEQYVPSLRMGNHLSYSYTYQQKQKLPSFSKEKNMLKWNWKNQQYDWAYPLSVNGHLFSTIEMKVLVNEQEYKAPNSFEAALQIMNPLFQERKGICYPHSILINNPCNKVQSEHGNVHGEVDVKELNNKWMAGFRISYEEIKGIKNSSAHQEITLKFEKE